MAEPALKRPAPLLLDAAARADGSFLDIEQRAIDAVLASEHQTSDMALAWALRCRHHHRAGRVRQAQEAADQARRWLQGLSGEALDWPAMVLAAEEGRHLAIAGHPDQALPRFVDALARARALGAQTLLPVYATWVGNARTRIGDAEGALAAYEEALADTGPHTPATTRGLTLHNLAVLHGELEDHETAIALCRQADDAYGGEQLEVIDSLALMLALAGQLDEARRVAQRQRRLADETGASADRLRALRTLASVELDAGRTEAAAEAYDAAWELLDDTSAPFHFVLSLHTGSASVALERGDGARALELLDELAKLHGDVVDDRWQPRLERLRARALRMVGRHDEAYQALERAHAAETARVRAESRERLAQLRVRHELGRERRVAERMARARLQAEERLEQSTLRLHASLVATQEARRARDLLESQLLESQRLQAVGLLAAGLAHDVNNLLTVTLGHLDLAEIDDPDQLEEHLARARSATHRSAALCSRLLSLTRGRPQANEWLRVDDFVREVGAMLTPMMPRTVALDVRPAAPDRRVMADPSHLEQVLLNLLVNARDAVGADGRIELSTDDAPDELPGGWAVHGVRLTVRDDGCGMPPEVLARAAEPLFTTKPGGRGTGLGLSTIHSVARRLGGRLDLRSTVGEGTEASVWLPAEAAELHPVPLDGVEVAVVWPDPVERQVLVCTLAACGARALARSPDDSTPLADLVVGPDDRADAHVGLPPLATLGPDEVVQRVRAAVDAP
jgi:signal transduction histidine kinase